MDVPIPRLSALDTRASKMMKLNAAPTFSHVSCAIPVPGLVSIDRFFSPNDFKLEAVWDGKRKLWQG